MNRPQAKHLFIQSKYRPDCPYCKSGLVQVVKRAQINANIICEYLCHSCRQIFKAWIE